MSLFYDYVPGNKVSVKKWFDNSNCNPTANASLSSFLESTILYSIYIIFKNQNSSDSSGNAWDV